MFTLGLIFFTFSIGKNPSNRGGSISHGGTFPICTIAYRPLQRCYIQQKDGRYSAVQFVENPICRGRPPGRPAGKCCEFAGSPQKTQGSAAGTSRTPSPTITNADFFDSLNGRYSAVLSDCRKSSDFRMSLQNPAAARECSNQNTGPLLFHFFRNSPFR